MVVSVILAVGVGAVSSIAAVGTCFSCVQRRSRVSNSDKDGNFIFNLCLTFQGTNYIPKMESESL